MALLAISDGSRLTSRRWRPRESSGRLTVLLFFLPPALVLFSLFVVMPVGEAAWYSLFNWNGFGSPTKWVGLDNYRFVIENKAFFTAIRNNLLIIAASLLLQLPLALVLAIMLADRFRGAVALRFLLGRIDVSREQTPPPSPSPGDLGFGCVAVNVRA